MTTEFSDEQEVALSKIFDAQIFCAASSRSAVSSMMTFAFGAFVPLVPFLFGSGVAAALWSIGVSAVTLFAVGAGISNLTGRPLWWSGARMLVVGAVAAGITYGVGKALHVGGAVG